MRVVLLGNGEPERAKMAAKPPIFASDVELVPIETASFPHLFFPTRHKFIS